jgi:electron transport complex protein RnfC
MNAIVKAQTFKGGVHPLEYKEMTKDIAFVAMPLSKEVAIPVAQHIGKPGSIKVKKRDEVKIGTLLAEQDGFISASVHSPVCGKVKEIVKHPNVGGYLKESIIITVSDSLETDFMEPIDPPNITKEQIIERVKHAGIVGQGGAAFPTYVKLMPPSDKKIDWVILNGAECEPYLTRDYRFMMERTEDVLFGLLMFMKAIGVKKGAIGIEENKPKAIEKMTKASEKFEDIQIFTLKTKYPQGAEKMLIKAITGKKVPPGKLPMEVGVVIQNIGTAIAVNDAILKGEPMITAALTVAGRGINEPKNIIVPIGTKISEVIEFCGGMKNNTGKVIVGGPMMGIAQFDFDAPVMKATSGLLVLAEEEISDAEVMACLSCGKCIEVCAVNLVPTNLVKYSQMGKFELAENEDIMTCMECGTCAYNCPSSIPMVQWIRFGKKMVQKQRMANKN